MKITTTLVGTTAKFVNSFFAHQLDPEFTYHNGSHTAYVVNAVKKLCTAMRVTEHAKNILLIAAWFHDLGFTKQIENHEQIGAQLADEFLKSNKINESDIAVVKSCILSTCYPQHPTTFLQKIICDADLMYLGDRNFFKTSAGLRKEWEFTRHVIYSDMDWYKLNLNFISSHHFHTTYCVSSVEKKKNKNVKLIENKYKLLLKEAKS